MPIASTDTVDPTASLGTSSGAYPDKNPNQGEAELVDRFTKAIDQQRSGPRARAIADENKKHRRYAAGEPRDGEAQWLVTTNLIETTMTSLVPELYARNPDVSIRPNESISPETYGNQSKFAKTCEIIVSKQFRKGKLKPAMKRGVRSTLTVSVGWVKAAMSQNPRTDPVLQRRANDLQENIAQYERHTASAEQESTSETDVAYELARSQLQLKSINAQMERAAVKQMIYEPIPDEDIVVSPEIRDLQDYVYAKWISQRIHMRPDDVVATYKVTKESLARATRYAMNATDVTPAECRQDDTGEWLAIEEVWDREAGVIHLFVCGCDWLLRPSEPPSPSSSRFYGFFLIAWSWVDGRRRPLSLVAGLESLQDEYSATRSQFRAHRQTSTPVRMANGAVVNSTDIKKITHPTIGEVVVLENVSPDVPIGNLVVQLDGARIDPALYDPRPILADIDTQSGLNEMRRQGGAGKPKTLGEAEIIETAATVRASEREDVLEEVLTDIATYTLELCLGCYTLQDAIQWAGVGAVWPEGLSVDQFHDQLSLEVVAGSMGKPYTSAEKQTWAELLGVIDPMIQQIANYRRAASPSVQVDPATGMPTPVPGDPMASALADIYTDLLRRTLELSGSRIDPETLIPKLMAAAPEATSGGMPGMLPQPGMTGPQTLPAPEMAL